METVEVSQAPVVSEAAAVATPAAGGATLAALPSAVQDLARFFLSLSGSASLGAAGGVAGAAVPASGVGVPLCPSTPGSGAVAFGAASAIPAGAGGPPPAFAAVPGSSGRQHCQEASRPSRRRCRSSSDRTDRHSKRHPRGRSPSPGPSSRRRERSYRSDSDSSGYDRAETSPPRAGRAPGGTPGDFRSAPAGDRSPRPGPSGWTSRFSRERTIITRVPVIDPTRLRVERMMTGLVLWTRLTLTGMTHSGLSWASSGDSTPCKSLQEPHQLDARLLLHRSMG